MNDLLVAATNAVTSWEAILAALSAAIAAYFGSKRGSGG